VSASGRLQELGLALPEPPAAVASFEPFVVDGELVYVSGQLATGVDGRLVASGTVGADVDRGTATACARASALNVLAQLARVPGGLDALGRIVKLTVFVASAPGLDEQSLVAEGASDLLVAVLGDCGRHARSVIGVVALPFGSPVEVECTARVVARPAQMASELAS
jgi:enamine deaminase RidA (YjgF/YER057c/UK114 family)